MSAHQETPPGEPLTVTKEGQPLSTLLPVFPTQAPASMRTGGMISSAQQAGLQSPFPACEKGEAEMRKTGSQRAGTDPGLEQNCEWNLALLIPGLVTVIHPLCCFTELQPRDNYSYFLKNRKQNKIVHYNHVCLPQASNH